jgi:hypothetical protein
MHFAKYGEAYTRIKNGEGAAPLCPRKGPHALPANGTFLVPAYQSHSSPSASIEEGMPPEAVLARHERARRSEQQFCFLCPEDIASHRPELTLTKRCRRYLASVLATARLRGRVNAVVCRQVLLSRR